MDSRNDDYGSLTGYPYPNNDWSRAIPGTLVEVSIGALQWMGWEHIMMLQDDGTIVGWGNNSHTVLGGTQSQDPSQPVTVEARGSQATPATDPTAQDVAPVSERNETRADGGRDVGARTAARRVCRAGAWCCWPVPACCCVADR